MHPEHGPESPVRANLPGGAANDVPVHERAPAKLAPPRARILIIDDEPFVARALARSMSGHDVTVLASAKEAILRLADTRFDVIFCDLMMPSMTGMDLHEAVLRGPHSAQAAAFVFMTGGAYTTRAREFLERVGAPCLDKPFDSSEVRELIALAVARRDQPRSSAALAATG